MDGTAANIQVMCKVYRMLGGRGEEGCIVATRGDGDTA